MTKTAKNADALTPNPKARVEYETRQTTIKPGTNRPTSKRLWVGMSEANARKAAANADLQLGPVTIHAKVPGTDERQLVAVFDKNPAMTRETIETTDNHTKGTSDMTTDTSETTETQTTEAPAATVYTCYVWNAEGKVKGKPKEYKTLTGAVQFADKQSTTPGIREVTILGDDDSRRVSRHGETTVVTDVKAADLEKPASPDKPAKAESVATPAANAAAKAEGKNPAKVAAAKATIKPKVVATVEQADKPSAKAKLLDYKGSNTRYAQTLPKGARWVAYDPGTGRQVVLAKKPTDAELANVKGWDELAMPTEAKATEAA